MEVAFPSRRRRQGSADMGIDRGVALPADRVPLTHRAWVEVNLAAIRNNVQAIRRLPAPSSPLIAVVKADGYGHGAVAVARTALSAGASWLAVATLNEGIHLRRAGIEAALPVIHAAVSKDEG